MRMRKIYYGARRIVLIFFAFLFSPLIYVLIWRRRRRQDSDFRNLRILVIPHLTRIGDLACATPVFRAIKEKYPKSFLAVLVAGRLEGLLKQNPRVDELIRYRHNDLWGTIHGLRKKNFDWSFSLSGSAPSSCIAFLALIPRRAKLMRRPRPLSEIATDCMSNFKLLYRHHTYLPRRYLDLLAGMGIEHPEEVKEVFVSQAGEKKAEEFLRKEGIAPRDFLVGISITAGNKIKEWGDEKFRELAGRIVDNYGAKIVFLASKNDEGRIEAILFPGALKAVDFSLEELPSLIKRLKLFIAVDTGPIYIAHALKVPLIDIIGPVDPAEQPPQDERSILIKPPPHIRPSSFVFKRAGKPDEHKKALEATSVEDVLSGVDTLVRSKQIARS